jgi:hypothetical protein
MKVIKSISKTNHNQHSPRTETAENNLEFVIEVNYNHKKWIINKELIESQNLQKILIKTYPFLKLDSFNQNISNVANNSNTKYATDSKLKNILHLEKILNLIFKNKTFRESTVFKNYIEFDQYYHLLVLDTNELGEKTDNQEINEKLEIKEKFSHHKQLSEFNYDLTNEKDKSEKYIADKYMTDFNFSENSSKYELQTIDLKETEENVRYISDKSSRKESMEVEEPTNPFTSVANKRVICSDEKKSGSNLNNYDTVVTKPDSKRRILVRNKKKSCSVDLNPKNGKDSYVSAAISILINYILILFFKIKQL